MAEYKLRIQMDLDLTFEHDEDNIKYSSSIGDYPAHAQELIKERLSIAKDDLLSNCYVSMCYNNTALQEARGRIGVGFTSDAFESGLFDRMLGDIDAMGVGGYGLTCNSISEEISEEVVDTFLKDEGDKNILITYKDGTTEEIKVKFINGEPPESMHNYNLEDIESMKLVFHELGGVSSLDIKSYFS